jgi:hypothetical protein
MSIEVIKEGNVLRVVDSSEPIPEGRHLRLFTADEIQQAAARMAWNHLPEETRDDLMHQAQSASYREWMDDKTWDEAIAREDPGSWLPLADFKP